MPSICRQPTRWDKLAIRLESINWQRRQKLLAERENLQWWKLFYERLANHRNMTARIK